ncbi:SCP-like extracellular protein, putative [Talaromyces stipitatus ATCC 10500]|uniref:SCP-like extracellular protein, putative n=1 Tax=Talaromyces stipitatus (strain ATCC 10500 / CBS 375.48 / QM 6759 / NRRL 1006) TaxID=441959 RepID=B8MJZ6_TALSN|nr:SCP-like extracellular protein, putative [Talaromyces stipitatus ATCC 10500]XP_002484767.1 SCP-like extracellular protein, putative [Talaromyces stipitatus ATCC 10500]EED14813.1 SCP-like extracellular protein, putative [Talaromyces stipitatus ATCC 10500]EED14814.1 SCP-like extracellular protein, putative [Talaromyces stipitatus ATCC 10500]
MKGSLIIGALCALGAVASPLNMRVLVTDIEVTVVTITVTETPGYTPAAATTTVPASTTSVAPTTVPVAGAANLNNEYPRPPLTSTSTSTTLVVPSSSSTTFVAPEPTTTVAAAPAPTPVEPSTTSTSTSASTSPSVAPSSAGSSYQSLILNSHNIHRSNHSAPALTWNETLAESALKLANTCDYHHDTSLGPAANYGQNIAFGIDSDKVDEIITNMMYNDEMMFYQDLYGQANPDMSKFEKWGHFSQIVWLDTTSVGCATVTCQPLAESHSSLALPFTVCNYYPAGNYGGEYADNVLQPKGNAMVVAS